MLLVALSLKISFCLQGKPPLTPRGTVIFSAASGQSPVETNSPNSIATDLFSPLQKRRRTFSSMLGS